MWSHIIRNVVFLVKFVLRSFFRLIVFIVCVQKENFFGTN